MNNRSRATTTKHRFSVSYSEQEFRKLEKALGEIQALTCDPDIEAMRLRVEGQLFRHDARDTVPESEAAQ